ncbi:MAG: preprotein translocase subunit YajC [Bacteroidales bacterium]|nr:preprotein translocase subunit YajC [Bacteroidales bacterium]
MYNTLLQAQQGGGMGSMLIMVVVIILMMWLMGGSQRKQAKREAEFRKNMKKGDRVLFSGGIYGKVHEIGETTVDVEVSNGTILTVEKSMVLPASQPTEKK